MSRRTNPRLSTSDDKLLSREEGALAGGLLWVPQPRLTSRVRTPLSRSLRRVRTGPGFARHACPEPRSSPNPVRGAQSAPLDSARDSQNELCNSWYREVAAGGFWFCAFFHLGKESIRKDWPRRKCAGSGCWLIRNPATKNGTPRRSGIA
jgi:hypothetical protein